MIRKLQIIKHNANIESIIYYQQLFLTVISTFHLHIILKFRKVTKNVYKGFIEDQLPCKTGPQTHHSKRCATNKECLIQISKFKFSIVISGLTKILQRINELRPTHTEFERDYYESLLIVLDTLEKCLSSQAVQVKYDEAMNVKLLLTCLLVTETVDEIS